MEIAQMAVKDLALTNNQEVKTSVKVIGANGQISLGKEFAGRQVLVIESEPGVWSIRTARVIPDNEMWLHEGGNKDRLLDAAQFALDTNPSETNDLDSQLAKIIEHGAKNKA